MGAIMLLGISGSYVLGNCTYSGIWIPLIILIAIMVQYLLDRLLKKYYYGNCIAKINNVKIEFELEDNIRVIKLSDVTSYKIFKGTKSTTRLQLKNSIKNFSITVSNSQDFDLFCKELVTQLDILKTSP